MQRRVYQFIVFADKEVIYYMDPQETDVDYLALQKEHRFQNIYSASEMLSNTTKQLHPSTNTHPRNFRTQEYQFSLLETPNGLKMILVTSLRADNSADVALRSLFDLYVSLVKKNYMHAPNEIVGVRRFDQQVRKVLVTLE